MPESQPEPEPARVREKPPEPYPPGKFLDRLRDTHAAVRAQVEQGLSLREVARRLGLGRNTVRKYARAATPEAMLHGQWQDRTSKLDPCRPYLEQRITEGCTNLSRLHREIQERGARCSYSTLRDYVHPLRPGRRPASGRPPMARPPSPREATRWIMSHPDHLRTDDQLQLKALLTRSPELTAATSHVRTFATIMSNREGDRLRGWIADVCADEQCGLASFAAGLITDLDAIVFGMSTDLVLRPGRGPRQRPQARHVRSCPPPPPAQTAPARRQLPTTDRHGSHSGLITVMRDRSPPPNPSVIAGHRPEPPDVARPWPGAKGRRSSARSPNPATRPA